MLVYTPPSTLTAGYSSMGTYTPADSNPTFDANDELSFLANDAGQQAGGSVGEPAGRRRRHPPGGQGHRPARHLERRLRLPVPQQHPDRWLGRDHRGAVHLQPRLGQLHRHLQDGHRVAQPEQHLGLQPGALHGDDAELHPSSSVIGGSTTGSAISKGGATGVDVLDRTHYYVTVGCCRSEDTFDGGAEQPRRGRVRREHLRSGPGDPLLHRGQQLQVDGQHRPLLPEPPGHASPSCAATPGSPATAAPTTTRPASPA